MKCNGLIRLENMDTVIPCDSELEMRAFTKGENDEIKKGNYMCHNKECSRYEKLQTLTSPQEASE